MSQKKVDEYKKYKANRKEILAKEKRAKQRNKVIGTLAVVLFLAIFGVAAFQTYRVESLPDATYYDLIAQNRYGLLVPTFTEK